MNRTPRVVWFGSLILFSFPFLCPESASFVFSFFILCPSLSVKWQRASLSGSRGLADGAIDRKWEDLNTRLWRLTPSSYPFDHHWLPRKLKISDNNRLDVKINLASLAPSKYQPTIQSILVDMLSLPLLATNDLGIYRNLRSDENHGTDYDGLAVCISYESCTNAFFYSKFPLNSDSWPCIDSAFFRLLVMVTTEARNFLLGYQGEWVASTTHTWPVSKIYLP